MVEIQRKFARERGSWHKRVLRDLLVQMTGFSVTGFRCGPRTSEKSLQELLQLGGWLEDCLTCLEACH